jgi:hypothetical protein
LQLLKKRSQKYARKWLQCLSFEPVLKNGHLAQENLADEPDYQAVLTDLRDRLDHHLARAVLPLRRPDDAAGTVRKMSSLYDVTKRVGLLGYQENWWQRSKNTEKGDTFPQSNVHGHVDVA